MNKAALLHQLQVAYDSMADDPALECVDTLALMQEAIEDGIEYCTGKRPRHITSSDLDEEEVEP